MEIPKFEFRRFKPNRDLIRQTEAMLLQMMDFIPSNAAIFASLSKFKRLKNRYEVVVQIKAPQVQFVQNISSNDPVSAIVEVSEKIKEEILNWKIENLALYQPSFWNFKEVK